MEINEDLIPQPFARHVKATGRLETQAGWS